MKVFVSAPLRRITFAAMATVLLGSVGCASVAPRINQPSLDPKYRPGVNLQTGVVVGSVTALRDPYRESLAELAQYYIRSTSDSKFRFTLTSAAKYNPYTFFAEVPKCDEEGLAEECGRLFALELPLGDYEIYAVMAAASSATSTTNLGDWTVALEGYRFVVEPGSVAYLGNLNSRICVGSVSQMRSGVVAAAGNVGDEFPRDWPLLQARFPMLLEVKPERQVLKGAPWQWRRGADSGWQPPTGWPRCVTEQLEAL